ncbi:glycine tRNA synthetase [Escherichia coli]|uniref:Glycine--tRNA ligase alpha subunit n=1 Tax=Escherichia coli TaxID=562 RepID=A0A2X1QAF4_ECOLX|nr:glycine tRNA synthetase [Escherichia coli]
MEVTQFTYFQQVGGLECKPVTGEITYGLERLAMYIQGVDSVYDLVWSDGPLGKTTYGDVFHQNEVEQSTYNFDTDVDFLFTCFEQYEKEAQQLLALEIRCRCRLRAYSESRPQLSTCWMRVKHLRHRGQRYILRIRTLTKAVAEAYYASREALGFPMCNKISKRRLCLRKLFWWKSALKSCHQKHCASLAESFAANFTAELDNAGLAHGTVQWFAAPRRLALKVANLAEAQPDREIEKRGPAIAQAFDAEGNRAKRQKVGRVVAVLPLTRLSV